MRAAIVRIDVHTGSQRVRPPPLPAGTSADSSGATCAPRMRSGRVSDMSAASTVTFQPRRTIEQPAIGVLDDIGNAARDHVDDRQHRKSAPTEVDQQAVLVRSIGVAADEQWSRFAHAGIRERRPGQPTARSRRAGIRTPPL